MVKYLTIIWVITILLLTLLYMTGAGANEALSKFFPEAVCFSEIEDLNSDVQIPDTVKNAYVGYDSQGNRIVTIIDVQTDGFNGPIKAFVAFDNEGTVIKVIIYEHRESESYVKPMINGTFQKQFEGLSISDKISLIIGRKASKKGEIQAMTSATITSHAVAIGVSHARKAYSRIYIIDDKEG